MSTNETITAQQHHFVFPGFKYEKDLDNETHEVVRGKAKLSGYEVRLDVIRRKNLDFEADFLPANIYSADGNKLWTFKDENHSGSAMLVPLDDGQIIIALVGKTRAGKVIRLVNVPELFGSSAQQEIEEQILLKERAGVYLGRGVDYSMVEQLVLDLESEEQRKARESRLEAFRKREAAAVTLRQAEHQAKIAEKKRRIKEVLDRTEIVGFTSEGPSKRGIPVTSDEWPSLPHMTRVILVSAYDPQTTKCGQFLESFKVSKKPGQNPEKLYAVSVEGPPEPKRKVLVKVTKGYFTMALYESLQKIKLAQRLGLNGGTYAGVDEPDADGNVAVYQVHTDRIDSVGRFKAVAIPPQKTATAS